MTVFLVCNLLMDVAHADDGLAVRASRFLIGLVTPHQLRAQKKKWPNRAPVNAAKPAASNG
jgi:hypothetical protein